MCVCVYSLVHGVSGLSDSARRYPGRQEHAEEPVTTAWLNPGQAEHKPPGVALNCPRGQAGRGKGQEETEREG